MNSGRTENVRTGKFRTINPLIFGMTFTIGFFLMIFAEHFVIDILLSINAIVGEIAGSDLGLAAIINIAFDIIWILLSLFLAFIIAKESGCPVWHYEATYNNITFKSRGDYLVYRYEEIDDIDYEDLKFLWFTIGLKIKIKQGISTNSLRYLYPVSKNKKFDYPFTFIENIKKEAEEEKIFNKNNFDDERFGKSCPVDNSSDGEMPSISSDRD